MFKADNPIMRCDYPDPDIIRVGDVYYMVSTTMHFMPGCPVLKSYDLVNWEIVSYVYDTLEDNDAHTLQNGQNIYGKGMWAACLRQHKGKYYVCFAANDTHKNYLFVTDDIEGKWERREIEGFYHDCSLLFDDNDRVYIVYGHDDIHITELCPDLSKPLDGGLDRIILSDEKDIPLGYEGSHIYKINGKYYLFTIHAPEKNKFFRTEACFVANSLDGEFMGGDIVHDDLDFFGNGVAQGGVVDTPDGQWYMFIFQDRGAVGRIPVIMPIKWENDFPVIEKIPKTFSVNSTNKGYTYKKLWGSDDFYYKTGDKLKSFWQWNHNPDNSKWIAADGTLKITTDKLCTNLCQARNVLTQRSIYPKCSAEVTVNASHMNEGDYIGMAALQSNYGAIALTKRNGQAELVMIARKKPSHEDAHIYNPGICYDNEQPEEYESIVLDVDSARIGVSLDFTDLRDVAEFYYYKDGEKCKIGITHKLYFWLDHFVGCRFALFAYSTVKKGGTAEFSNFTYIDNPIMLK